MTSMLGSAVGSNCEIRLPVADKYRISPILYYSLTLNIRYNLSIYCRYNYTKMCFQNKRDREKGIKGEMVEACLDSDEIGSRDNDVLVLWNISSSPEASCAGMNLVISPI